jgi:hypothetical protein
VFSYIFFQKTREFILTGLIFLLSLSKILEMEPEKDIFEQWADEREKESWIIRKLRFIPLWWNHEGKYLHLEVKNGIKNLIYWFPIIWKDRNWDSHYIFEIMKHKLSSQADYIGRRDLHTRAQLDAKRMKLCVKLMKLVQDEFYSGEYSDFHKTKHWFEDIENKPGYSSWESRLLEENFDDYFKKYPLIYKRVINGEGIFSLGDHDNVSTDKKQRIAMNIGHINHDRARKLLFKIMEENIERWWD